jgi:uncharacterized phage infection (PIP) family protein YhgE
MQKIIIFIFAVILAIAGGSCASKPAVIVDTGDIERLRADYEQLRSQYESLQSDHSRLIAEQQFYADYYRHTTERIESGLQEIQRAGTENLDFIEQLRINIAILTRIINGIIAGEQGEGLENTKPDGEERKTD